MVQREQMYGQKTKGILLSTFSSNRLFVSSKEIISDFLAIK
jgi:hypothetical protein